MHNSKDFSKFDHSVAKNLKKIQNRKYKLFNLESEKKTFDEVTKFKSPSQPNTPKFWLRLES